MDNPIAILGAGNGGRAMAACLTHAGFRVNLFELPEFARGLEAILEIREIKFSGPVRNGTEKLNLVTTDIREALHEVDLVLICVPAFGQKRMAEVCIPQLRSGMTVVFMPGGFGSFLFYLAMKELGSEEDINLAEVATLPYGARIISPVEVVIHVDAIKLPTGVFPAARTFQVVKVLQRLYPAITAAEDILDAALNNLNPCIHSAPAILNTGRIEFADDFYLYREGITPSVRRVMVAVDMERQKVREAWGYGPPHYGLDPSSYENFEDYFGKGLVDRVGKKMHGPLSMKHRYITEDIPFGLVFYASAGDAVGVETPACDSLISLASLINEENYLLTGRTLAGLGLGDKNVSQVKKLLQGNSEKTPLDAKQSC
jgi:opine dehydrogenase